MDRTEVAIRLFEIAYPNYENSETALAIKDAFDAADAFLAEAANRAPVAAVEALRFDSDGDVIARGDDFASVSVDGYSGRATGNFARVEICAESRGHARKMVAAMLHAARQVKP